MIFHFVLFGILLFFSILLQLLTTNYVKQNGKSVASLYISMFNLISTVTIGICTFVEMLLEYTHFNDGIATVYSRNQAMGFVDFVILFSAQIFMISTCFSLWFMCQRLCDSNVGTNSGLAKFLEWVISGRVVRTAFLVLSLVTVIIDSVFIILASGNFYKTNLYIYLMLCVTVVCLASQGMVFIYALAATIITRRRNKVGISVQVLYLLMSICCVLVGAFTAIATIGLILGNPFFTSKDVDPNDPDLSKPFQFNFEYGKLIPTAISILFTVPYLRDRSFRKFVGQSISKAVSSIREKDEAKATAKNQTANFLSGLEDKATVQATRTMNEKELAAFAAA